MLKCDELRLPESCLNRADKNERIFVLLARDTTAPMVIAFWCICRWLCRKNKWGDMQIREAIQCAKLMIEQRKHTQPWKKHK